MATEAFKQYVKKKNGTIEGWRAYLHFLKKEL